MFSFLGLPFFLFLLFHFLNVFLQKNKHYSTFLVFLSREGSWSFLLEVGVGPFRFVVGLANSPPRRKGQPKPQEKKGHDSLKK